MQSLKILCALTLCSLTLGACSKSTPDARSQASDRAKTQHPQSSMPATPGVQKILELSLNDTVEDQNALAAAPHYTLELDVDYELLTFTGKETLRLTNTENVALKSLHFLLYPNTEELVEGDVPNLRVKNVRVNGQAVKSTTNKTVLSIPLPRALKPGKSLTVSMDLAGVIYRLKGQATNMQKMALEQLVQLVMGDGLQKGGYGIYSFGDDIMSLALWYPVLSAHKDGKWDLTQGSSMGDISHFDVSHYDVRVTAPKDVVVVATGVLAEQTEVGDRRQHQFVAGAVREFTVQMSKKYRQVSKTIDGVKVISWFREKNRASGERVLEYAGKALQIFNAEFGPYPYTELEVAEAPLIGGAGGVEFPGLVTIASMFYNDETEQSGDFWSQAFSQNPYMEETLEFVVAHEVAHQWWNAVVGSDSKLHPFVDEALANHSAILYFERAHGAEAADKQRVLQLRLPYQLARWTGSKDRPVDLPTKDYNNAMEYAAIVYGKGALFFEEYRKLVGDARYLTFFRSYYDRFKFKIARPEDLIGGIAEAAEDSTRARQLAQRWLHETHGDKDIGRLSFSEVYTLMAGQMDGDSTIKDMLKSLDAGLFGDIEELVSQILDPDGSVKGDVFSTDFFKLVMGFLGEGNHGFQTGMAQLKELLKQNPGLSKGTDIDLRTVLNITRQLAGPDEDSKKLLDAADVLLKMIER